MNTCLSGPEPDSLLKDLEGESPTCAGCCMDRRGFSEKSLKQHIIINTLFSHRMLDSITFFFVAVLLCSLTAFTQSSLANDGQFVREPVFGTDMYLIDAGPAEGLAVLLIHGVGEGSLTTLGALGAAAGAALSRSRF